MITHIGYEIHRLSDRTKVVEVFLYTQKDKYSIQKVIPKYARHKLAEIIKEQCLKELYNSPKVWV